MIPATINIDTNKRRLITCQRRRKWQQNIISYLFRRAPSAPALATASERAICLSEPLSSSYFFLLCRASIILSFASWRPLSLIRPGLAVLNPGAPQIRAGTLPFSGCISSSLFLLLFQFLGFHIVSLLQWAPSLSVSLIHLKSILCIAEIHSRLSLLSAASLPQRGVHLPVIWQEAHQPPCVRTRRFISFHPLLMVLAETQ